MFYPCQGFDGAYVFALSYSGAFCGVSVSEGFNFTLILRITLIVRTLHNLRLRIP